MAFSLWSAAASLPNYRSAIQSCNRQWRCNDVERASFCKSVNTSVKQSSCDSSPPSLACFSSHSLPAETTRRNTRCCRRLPPSLPPASFFLIVFLLSNQRYWRDTWWRGCRAPRMLKIPLAPVTPVCRFQHPVPRVWPGVKGRAAGRHLCNSFNNMCKWARGLSVFIRPGEPSRSSWYLLGAGKRLLHPTGREAD